MAAIAAILDFGPCPKSNGMILGPYLTPHQVSSKSVEEFFRNTVHKQTNKHTNKLEGEHSVECKTSAANTARSLK